MDSFLILEYCSTVVLRQLVMGLKSKYEKDLSRRQDKGYAFGIGMTLDTRHLLQTTDTPSSERHGAFAVANPRVL